jgi:hypothetical protein
MSELFVQTAQVWENNKAITTKTKPESAYMTTRFISLDPIGMLAAGMVNRLGTMPSWFTLPALKYATPKVKAPRNKYPKKLVDDKLSPKDKKTVQRYMILFNVNEDHARQIKNLMEAQGYKVKER